jgi:hypothetical protein
MSIFTNDLHALTGETIQFQNITTDMGLASAYIWDVGDGSSVVTLSSNDLSLVSATYTEIGTYSVSVTTISADYSITIDAFPNIITVDDYYREYSDDVLRVYGSNSVVYPYQLSDVKMKPNEWVTADNINATFYKLSEDIDYLKSSAKKYLEPPSKYYGWLGQSVNGETDISWHVTIPQISAEYNNTENIDDNSRGLNTIRDVSIYDDDMYVMTSTSLNILSSDYEATTIDTRAIKTIGDPFFDLTSMGINSLGHIYLLDRMVQKIVVFDNYRTNGWKFLYSWGKYGGPNTFNGFVDPIDLHVDSNDNVWITDSGNNIVKKYTNSGSWLMNISNTNFAGLVGTAVDDDNNVHVLMTTKCMKFSSRGTFINTYNVTPSGHVAKKIINGRDGFMYISYDKSIVKITKNGVFAGSFGDTFTGISYYGISHDVKRNLYVTNNNSILKFYEKVTIDEVYTDTGIKTWDINDIYISKDEYIQDWVYNRSISRMWDNIEIVKRSITAAISETTDAQGKIENVIVGFTTEQYTALFNSTPKEDVFIGINEIVSADVINRCLTSLYSTLDLLIETISQ